MNVRRPYHWLDELPLDDPDTYAAIRTGDNLGLFQVESMGQMHLVASHQPESFQDLVTQVAIFRPGAIAVRHGASVHSAAAGR